MTAVVDYSGEVLRRRVCHGILQSFQLALQLVDGRLLILNGLLQEVQLRLVRG